MKKMMGGIVWSLLAWEVGEILLERGQQNFLFSIEKGPKSVGL